MTDAMAGLALAACPFCGKQPMLEYLLEDGEEFTAWVRCACGSEQRESRTKELAVEKWNRRSTAQPAMGREEGTFVAILLKRLGVLIDTAEECNSWEQEAKAEMQKAVRVLSSPLRRNREEIAKIIASKFECEKDCQSYPRGCGCSEDAADALIAAGLAP